MRGHYDPLFDGVRSVVDVAIARLREFEPPEGYYLAFSGGKDSSTIKKLADMAGVKYDAHYAVTTIDPPELVAFIRANHQDVSFERARRGFFARLPEKALPLRHRRWCCAEYKEARAPGRLVVTGVRWAESARRSSRRVVEHCLRDKSQRFLHPIIDWTDGDVWSFLSSKSVPVCSLYSEGFKRLGCVLCPMTSSENRAREAERWPKIAQAWKRAVCRLYERNKNRAAYSHWKSGEALFSWWMSANPEDTSVEQVSLFADSED